MVAMVLSALTFGATKAKVQADAPGTWGAVFTLTNEPTGNRLAVFARFDDDSLSNPSFYSTGGNGSGNGLGSEGALALALNSQYLYAVNAGSSTISVFELGAKGPKMVQLVPSGGSNPVSLTVFNEVLYVLNAGGSIEGEVDCIAGFTINRTNGYLKSINGSVAHLSAANTSPAEIAFSSTGKILIVTEKATNLISLFALNNNHVPIAHSLAESSGATPYGFGVTSDDLIVVAEAGASTVSSYGLHANEGFLEPVSVSVKEDQSAACWIAITDDDEFAYAANTGSNTITGFKISAHGVLTLLETNGVTAKTGSKPADMTILDNQTLFVLNSADGSVGVYDIARNGTLNRVQVIGGLPETHPAGLVVR
jgi:6-phosphogluconolactonase (cycloisomerase 2 family)